MNFGKVIEGIREGKRSQRKGWNGKSMYIFDFMHSVLVFSEDINFDKEVYDISECIDVIQLGTTKCDDVYKLDDFILLKTANNHCIPWNASQADMLADDWEFID